MKLRRAMGLVCLFVILAFGVYAMSYTFQNVEIPYSGSADATALYADPSAYDNSGAQGISDIIVNTNLEKTMAVNNVAAIVFDYRGFDTIGESFILLTAIAGSFVILSKTHKPKKMEERK